MKLEEMKYAYFIGIGGIGMSAIARYFHSLGIHIYGYDRTETELTKQLASEGMAIHYEDSISLIPSEVLDNPEDCIFIYTPAIPKDHQEWNYLVNREITFYKRSEVLGIISRDAFCIAVAGTHGKTTTSTLIAHVLFEANINFTAFLGGISSNYGTNYISKTDGQDLFGNKRVVVLEADEFDRSFHRLSPDIAVVTAIDPDHLDIYGTREAFFEAFAIFTQKIKTGGSVVIQNRVDIPTPQNIQHYTYTTSLEGNSSFKGTFTGIRDGHFTFDYSSSIQSDDAFLEREITNIYSGLPGFHNIENATAAIGVCMDLLNLDRYDVKQAIKHYRGVKRRFEFLFKKRNLTVIDDYAHHPEELRAIITSVRELYPEKKILGIFQPHLFTRTRDFADGFGESLSLLDELILMDIYPAREQPIPGVDSQWLLEKVRLPQKSLQSETQILTKLKQEKPELVLILGAGDIDKLSPKIKELYETF